ncbi:MAG: hypothetical protein MZW92_52065 [Comamonadaceae bacterium]|nr:hypothetical protein [Comamonadaceae bacterium]
MTQYRQRALERGGRCQVPLAAVEQLCNLQVRWASGAGGTAGARKRRGGAPSRKSAEARARLANACWNVAPSAERRGLLGSAGLRLAALVRGRASGWDALEPGGRRATARRWSGRRRRRPRDARLRPRMSGATPWRARVRPAAAGRGARRRGGARPSRRSWSSSPPTPPRCRRAAGDFWNAIAPVECELLRRTLGGDLERHGGYHRRLSSRSEPRLRLAAPVALAWSSTCAPAGRHPGGERRRTEAAGEGGARAEKIRAGLAN